MFGLVERVVASTRVCKCGWNDPPHHLSAGVHSPRSPAVRLLPQRVLAIRELPAPTPVGWLGQGPAIAQQPALPDNPFLPLSLT